MVETSLQQIAKQRWLKTTELLDLLQNPIKLQQILPLLETHFTIPQSGSLMLFKKLDRGKNWRQDGVSYNTRKNNSSVQESQTRIKENGQDIAVCSYTKGNSLSRRAYWLLQDDSLILLHYLADSQPIASISDLSISQNDPSFQLLSGQNNKSGMKELSSNSISSDQISQQITAPTTIDQNVPLANKIEESLISHPNLETKQQLSPLVKTDQEAFLPVVEQVDNSMNLSNLIDAPSQNNQPHQFQQHAWNQFFGAKFL